MCRWLTVAPCLPCPPPLTPAVEFTPVNDTRAQPPLPAHHGHQGPGSCSGRPQGPHPDPQRRPHPAPELRPPRDAAGGPGRPPNAETDAAPPDRIAGEITRVNGASTGRARLPPKARLPGISAQPADSRSWVAAGQGRGADPRSRPVQGPNARPPSREMAADPFGPPLWQAFPGSGATVPAPGVPTGRPGMRMACSLSSTCMPGSPKGGGGGPRVHPRCGPILAVRIWCSIGRMGEGRRSSASCRAALSLGRALVDLGGWVS